ncbi:uncharacterized protein znf518b [Gouania willdenowi]|uniref:uncharacterized protein znf518b n=1 Tax=Gouania willdenowi TaxID=441366 RepID=UPI0010559058|nr:uncharacterized protein LOC114471099 [Gouania willdenowi]
MKPVSYQVLSSSVNGVQPDFGFHSLSGASKVRFPERTGLDSAETSVYNKSVTDNKQTHYTCFYCNSVFLREVHLFEHMKQHAKHFPYVCPYCAQGYVKRLCLVNHIERFHSKDIIQGSAKSGRPKVIQDSVRGAIRSTPTSDPSPVRPYVHVTAPTPAKPAVRVEKDQQLGKQSVANSSNTSNGNAEHFSLNGHMQHNRALTVSLPDEVNIPAGCLVELVEVKTVNGTKELKLRVVSQQETKSAVKEKRNAAYQNTALVKPLSSTLKHPIKVTPTTMGACTVNRKRCEITSSNVEQSSAVSSSIFRNPVSVNKRGLKRQSQEIINLESNILSKVPKVIVSSKVNPVREGPIKLTIPANHKALPPTVSGPRVTTARTGICQKVVGESKIEIPENSKIVPQQRKSDTKTIQAAPLAMTFEPGGSHLSSKAITNSVREALALSLISRPPVQRSSPPARPQAASTNKDSDVNQVFSLNKTMSIKTSVDSNHTTLRMSPQSREAQPKKVPAQSFPVISSVFSLSQQPENPQGAIKPVLLALRGVVLDKLKSGSTHQEDEPSEGPMLGNTAWVETKSESFTHEILTSNHTNESIKEEQDKDLPRNAVQVKEEKYNPPPIQIKDDDKSCGSPDWKHSTMKKPVSPKPSHDEASASTQTSQQLLKNEHDVSSKFLTVSLERMRVGMLDQQQSGPKQQKSLAHVSTGGHCYVMPLSMNQPVKRPGPNQPVVVLNHPKPRLCGANKTMADSCNSNAATVQELPECQILKMRLSKVMGQKYEVMGYTVKVSQ